MPRFIKKASKKIGLPPGSLIHIGKSKQKISKIQVFDFTLERYEERTLSVIEEAFEYRDQNSVTWINIDGLEQIEILKSLNQYFGIHDLVAEDVVNTGHRPKIEDHGDYLFIILKMLYIDEKSKDIYSEQMSFILGTNYVLSFQERTGDVFDPLRDRIRFDKGRVRKMGADYLMYLLMDSIIDNYFVVLEFIGERLDELEDRLMKDAEPGMTREIHLLKRGMIYLRKQIWPLRELIGSLQRNESKLMSQELNVYVRDLYDHIIQAIDVVESYRDMLSGLQDIYLSSISNKMNEVMKTLTIFAAIFIPLTFMVGIYGMNFENMPELKWKYGYQILLCVMFLVGGGMMYYFKKRRWF